jgi:phosphate transport system substrate-binding protein
VRIYGAFAQARVMEMEDDEALRALCSNVDFAVVSRRIADAELTQCRKWGIELAEWMLGYQAVVLTAGPAAVPAALTPREVFLALARRIPDPAEPSRLIDNPNVTWHDVDARLDYRTIDVLIPSDATTRAAFLQLILEPGCEAYPWIRKLRMSDRLRYYDICHQLRGDGRYREVELTGTFITQRLWAEPDWLVFLSYSYYAAHRAELMDTMLEGPPATLATLADGSYLAARPVYVYARRSQLSQNPGARILAYELTNPSAVGPQGSLVRLGLVPREGIVRPMKQGYPLMTAPLPPALESLQPDKEKAR